MLGRRNCQRFLREYFCVPKDAENSIIDFGYQNTKKEALLNSSGKDLPIIPDIRFTPDKGFAVNKSVECVHKYPQISLMYIMQLERKVQERFGIVANYASNGSESVKKDKHGVEIIERIKKKSSWFGRKISGPVKKSLGKMIIGIGLSVGKKMAAKPFIESVIRDMCKRGLLKDDLKG
jgi:hypothetical protein